MEKEKRFPFDKRRPIRWRECEGDPTLNERFGKAAFGGKRPRDIEHTRLAGRNRKLE